MSSSHGGSENLANETIVHGVLVNVGGTGILLTGSAGIGKSACALELVRRGHKLIADDVVVVERQDDQTVHGYAPSEFAGILAVRSLGAFDVRQIFSDAAHASRCAIDACIELRERNTIGPSDPFDGWDSDNHVAGVNIRRLVLAAGGESIATLIETAAKLVQTPGAVITAASFAVDN